MTIPSEQRLQVRVNGSSERAIIEAHGEVDLSTAPRLCTILKAMAHQPRANVVVDLRPTTYLGTAGISALITAHQDSSNNASPFEVQVRAGSQPESILREAEVHRLFSIVVWDLPSGNLSHEQTDKEQPGMIDATVHGTLELRIPSDVFQVGRVRHLTEYVLSLTGVDDGWIGDFVTAIGEAVANAVTHGSPAGGPGYVVFSLKPGPEFVTAEVQDFGPGIENWSGEVRMPPPESRRGRGLGMMKIFADKLEVQTGGSGTLVRIHKSLCDDETLN